MSEILSMDVDLGGSELAQLLYVSRSLIKADSALQMSDILAEARVGNARDGVTGVLTAVDGRFVQVIEGAPQALETLMGRLSRDPRHTDIQVLERRPVETRAFGDWDMVSPRLAPEELAALGGVLGDNTTGLDAVVPMLAKAVARQEAVLEGRTVRPTPKAPVEGAPTLSGRRA